MIKKIAMLIRLHMNDFLSANIITVIIFSIGLIYVLFSKTLSGGNFSYWNSLHVKVNRHYNTWSY